MTEITVCKGGTMETVQQYLGYHNLRNQCRIMDFQCKGGCSDGPHMSFNGEVHNHVDHAAIVNILDYYFCNKTAVL